MPKKGYGRRWVEQVVRAYSRRTDAIDTRDGRGPRRLDAGETFALTEQLTSLMARSYDVKRGPLEMRRFFPVKIGVSPPWAETVKYAQYDFVGSARKIKNYSDDLPLVNGYGQEFSKAVHGYGDAFILTFQDLRAAAHLGRPIQTDLITAARRAFDQAVEQVAAFGDPDDAVAPYGFFNNTNVTPVVPITGSWLTATPDQIIADLILLWESIPRLTMKNHYPTHLLLDSLSWTYIGRKVGTDDGGTIRKWIAENLSPRPQVIDTTDHLDLADAAGTGPRVMAYEYGEDNGWIDIPMDFEVHAPEQVNLSYKSACEGRTAGAIMPYPLSMAYMDGI